MAGSDGDVLRTGRCGGRMRSRVGRGLAIAVAAYALMAPGCDVTVPGGGGGNAATPSADVPATPTYRVVKGDSLSTIAERECGDRTAAISIYDVNRGRLQPDGDALLDPDRLVAGWDLVLDCSAAGSAVFTPAPTEPDPLPQDPGEPIETRTVPVHRITLRPPGGAEGDGGDCLGLSSLPAKQVWVLRAGAAAAGIELRHGERQIIDPQGFDGHATVKLVDSSGKRVQLDDADIGNELYADPQLPPGRYFVEAHSGNQVGTGTVDILRAETLSLIRSTGTTRFDIVGGTQSIALTIFRWASGACDQAPEKWQDVDDLDLFDGVGRLTIVTTGAARGTYCVAVRNEPNPADQCRSDRKLQV